MQAKIIIPQNLNEIPLNKYLEWASIPEDTDPKIIEARVLQIFCGIRPYLSRKMKRKQREEIIFDLLMTLKQPPEFHPRFTYKGIEYGIIPNFDDMIVGEFADLDSIKDYQVDLAKVMSILYRPIVETQKDRYQIEPYEPTREKTTHLDGMPSGIAMGALVFFWNLKNELLKFIPNSMREAMMLVLTKKELGGNMGGMDRLLVSQMETLNDLIQSQTSTSISAYYGLPIMPTTTGQLLKTTKQSNVL